MSGDDFSEKLRQFIFEHVDSVEQIDVLLFLRQRPDEWWTPEVISHQLRSSPSSVSQRLVVNQQAGLIEVEAKETVDGASGRFRYNPQSADLEQLVSELAEAYKVRPHKILGLIFSPIKNARQFADAFAVSKTPNKNKGDENG